MGALLRVIDYLKAASFWSLYCKPAAGRYQDLELWLCIDGQPGLFSNGTHSGPQGDRCS